MRRNDNPARGSRWLWRCLILVCFLFTVTLIQPADVQAASRDSLKKKLTSTTSDKICGFYYRDLDGDGDREAVGLTSNKMLSPGSFEGVRLWYVSDEKCTCFYSEATLTNHPELWKVKGTYLFRIDRQATGSTRTCSVWRFTRDEPQKLDLSVYNLERIKGN